jgi:hypothetical protein
MNLKPRRKIFPILTFLLISPGSGSLYEINTIFHNEDNKKICGMARARRCQYS